MDRNYGTFITKNQAALHEYRTLIQPDARQRCPALIVLKEDNNNNGLRSAVFCSTVT